MSNRAVDRSGAALFVLGIVFIAIGARHRGLLVVGLIFLVLGATRRARR
jgi:hypothetical protein